VRTTYMTRIAVTSAVVALAAAGCGSKSTPAASSSSSSTGSSSSSSSSSASSSSSGTASNANFQACMVTDTGGIDDRSFNASAWKGMQDAATDGKAKVKYVQSATENDYVPNITNLEGQSCNLIVTVGGLMADATDGQAEAKAGQNFAIVDNGSANSKGKVEPNVHGMEFNTAQGAFLAGYLAAASSKSGVVATWGGMNIPPVTIYMDGFWEGVQYYNKAKSKSVKVLGWDETNPGSGTFANSFTDTNKGKSISDGFINQGADIIFPVAGGAGRGATASAKANKAAKVIWVDTDGCVSDQEDCSVFLASVTKGIETAVKKTVEDAAAGNFKGGTQDILDLSNGGTDLVYGSQLASSVPSDLQTEITALKSQIAGGTIKISSPSQPK
jgi:basic membrane protein A and related proteins